MRRFLPDAAYPDEAMARVLRSADGTGMLVFVPGAGPMGADLTAGEYRLQLIYRRENTVADAGSLVLSQAGDADEDGAPRRGVDRQLLTQRSAPRAHDRS